MSKQSALLVDDSRSARFYLRNLLRQMDIEVLMAESGEQALEMLKDQRPDIIFMDHLMPGIDGFETTQAIKRNPATSHIPVVMCTSNEGPDYIREARSIGAIDILPKPPTESKLHQIFDQVGQWQRAAQAAPSAPAPAPVPASISDDKIRGLARAVAQEVLETALDAGVRRVLAGLWGDMKTELQQAASASANEAAEKAASALIENARATIRNQVLGQLRTDLDAVIHRIHSETQAKTTALIDVQVGEVSTKLRHGMDEQLSRLRSEVESGRQQWLREVDERVKHVAQATAASMIDQTAESLSSRMAKDTSSVAHAGRESAVHIARETVAEAMQTTTAAIEQLKGQVKLFAAAAAGAGILAAVVLFLLK